MSPTPRDDPPKRTELERLLEVDGVTLPAGVRSITVRQVGVLLEAMQREVTRMDAEEKFDHVAGFRVIRMLRQLVPFIQMREEDAAGSENKQDPPPKPPGLAARIAAESRRAPSEAAVASNGHTTQTP